MHTSSPKKEDQRRIVEDYKFAKAAENNPMEHTHNHYVQLLGLSSSRTV
jgi:hypothetical protein